MYLPCPRLAGVKTSDAASWAKQLWQCVLLAILACGSYFVVSHFLFQSVQVVGESMWPTLKNADHYFLNRAVYYVHSPQRKDIVVVKDPTDGVFVVKRIIAMPGESVLFKSGFVYVNGKRLSEPYVSRGNFTYTLSGPQEQMILCGKDQYFVLGDNRENSFDSRAYGPVHRQNILGTVVP
ncbi:MAG: signal peptidase I [Verrucomicrobiota bacterium]